MALVLGSLALAACGGDSATDSDLTAGERSSLARSKATIVAHCRRLGLFVAGRRGPPTAEDREAIERATGTLIAIAQSKPHAAYSSTETVALVLGDLAERLEAINCAPDLERRLEAAQASLPPP